MRALCTTLLLLLFASLAGAEETVQIDPQLLSGLIKQHCLKCHGANDPEGDLRLDNVSLELSSQEAIRTWHRVFNALRNGSMPPEDEPRPDAGKLKVVVKHLFDTLAAAEPLVGRPPQYKAGDIEIPDGALLATTRLVHAPDGAKVEIIPDMGSSLVGEPLIDAMKR